MRGRPRLAVFIPVAAALLLLGGPAGGACPAGERSAVSAVPASPAALTSLRTSLRPLVARFNEDADRLRFVALLSPT